MPATSSALVTAADTLPSVGTGGHDPAAMPEEEDAVQSSFGTEAVTGAARGGRPPREELVHRPGPNTLVVLVGASDGRWSRELAAGTSRGAAALKAVQDALQGSGQAWGTLASSEAPRAVGFAVLEAWRFVHGPSSSVDTFHLMSAACAYSPKLQCPRFLEHVALATAVLVTTDEELVTMPGPSTTWGSSGTQPRAAPLSFIGALSGQPVRITRGPNTFAQRTAPLREVLQMWSANLGVTTATVTPWTLWTPLAAALAEGVWAGDVSPLHYRWQKASWPPLLPPTKQVQLFLRGTHSLPLPPTGARYSAPEKPSVMAVMAPKRGSVHPFTAELLSNALQLGQHLASQAKAGPAIEAALRLLYPSDWEHRVGELLASGHRMPKKDTLRRSRARLDCAAMLQRRLWYGEQGPTYRYLGIDASPQRPGLEVLVTVERVIRRSDVRGMAPEQRWPMNVEQRRLPVSVLGHGRCGLAEKVQANVHQTWLEYGPSVAQVCAANADVRQILSDMGTESAIVDYPNVVAQCVYRGQPKFGTRPPLPPLPALEGGGPQASPSGQPVPAAGLYPMALAVPGMQHILDNVIRDTLRALPWWPAWQAQAKLVCQWLGNQGHREFLQHRLPEADPATQAHRAALVTGCDRFAEWRWKTLSAVTRDLRRLEGAARAALATVSQPSDLATRDSRTAQDFLTAARDASFWDRARGLGDLVQPVTDLAGWVRGCDCHEAELLAGKAVVCPWKGCRAPGLATRLHAFEELVRDIRDKQTLPGLSGPEVVSSTTRMLANFRLKTQWVHEAPYLIWQAGSPEVAKRFLDSHDAAHQAGQVVHRVTAHFAGASSPLRRAMEAHAAGEGMSGALRAELLSYQLCILDDTWVEATHRDISGIGKRKGASKMPFRLATARLQQNLDMLAKLSADDTAFFNQVVFAKWRSIGRGATQRQPRRLRDCQWMGTKAVNQVVYRLGSESLANWSATLRLVVQPLAHEDAALSRTQRLKAEYLRIVSEVIGHRVCSVPRVASQDAARAHESALCDALAILDAASDGQQEFFQFVLDSVRRKKQARTAAHARMLAMCCPVMQQGYQVWARRSSMLWDVLPDGLPEVKDFLHLAEWPVLRAGLRFWQQGPSDTLGCVQLSAPVVVTDIQWDFRQGPVPTIVVLEKLAGDGWVHGPRQLTEHTSDSPQVMHVAKNPLVDKPYLQCLACLPQLLSATFPAMHAGQPASYYACLLRAGTPEAIPVGQTAGYYQRALVSGAAALDAPLQALSDRPTEEGGSKGADSGDEPMGSFGGGPGHPASRPGKRKASAQDSPLRGALWRPLQELGRPGPGGSGVSAAGPGQLLQPVPGQPASSSASAPPGALPPAMPGAEAQRARHSRDTGSARQAVVPRDVVVQVGGVDIVKDTHLEPGMKGHYSRFKARCPHHLGNPPCTKARNCGASQTATFGEMEPAAYLGVWLQRRDDFVDRASHMAYAPALREIQAFMLEQGWPMRAQ